ncbi:hypothetical protein ABIC03_007431 [Bradyrhizobium sp. RT6a]
MILCLVRAIRFGRQMYPGQAQELVFPADSGSGHLAETKEHRDMLSKWGNDLRQAFRTIAASAGVSEIDAKLLMNHAIPGVNGGYITRHKLLEDHLRSQQRAISSAVFSALGASMIQERSLQAWLGRGGSRLGLNGPLPIENKVQLYRLLELNRDQSGSLRAEISTVLRWRMDRSNPSWASLS